MSTDYNAILSAQFENIRVELEKAAASKNQRYMDIINAQADTIRGVIEVLPEMGLTEEQIGFLSDAWLGLDAWDIIEDARQFLGLESLNTMLEEDGNAVEVNTEQVVNEQPE